MNVITGTYVETVSRQAADLKTRAQPLWRSFEGLRSGESHDKPGETAGFRAVSVGLG